ncbi:GNAT family N-acetyltransferase [Plantactinospora sp. GCM10030261]|uniref:GNAT family N-acetyltransferase n=1 Tax=Plantactinospora sp. GCM10030261 TaxID=3273420 RepID=UPI00360836D6
MTDMVETVTVRRAAAGDVPALADLRRAWTEETVGPVADPEFADRFAAWYAAEAPTRLFWLAEIDARPVGMVNLVAFTRMPRPGRESSRWGYLGNAFVLEEHRNAGVGAKLVTALLAYTDAEGFARVVLSPSEASRPFYGRVGFGPADMLLARVPG